MGDADKTCKYSHLNRLSTSELEEILRAEIAQPDNEDTDMVLYIMEVIDQRESGKSEESISEAKRAWNEFQTIYNTPEGTGQSLYPSDSSSLGNTQTVKKNPEQIRPSKHNHRRLYRSLATVAALLIVILVLIPPAFGYESIYQMIGQWTSQAFRFEGSPSPGNSDPVQPEGISGEYASLEEALAAHGIEDAIVPTQLPERFELVRLAVTESPDFGETVFSAYYKREGSPLTILVIYNSNPQSSKYEKDDSPVEEYVSNGITYYLFENVGQQVATWYIDSYECSISRQ